MLTIGLVLFGAVLLALVLADRAVRRLPLTPSVIYLAVGASAGALLGAPPVADIVARAPLLAVVTEMAVLVSLFAVGLRLRTPHTLRVWRVALLLAGPGVVVAIAGGTLAAMWLLQLPWPVALLLASVMAPTDPVLASEVQIRSEQDRDAVRLSLTAEGGLNDGSSLPAVMLALGLMGLHTLNDGGLLGAWRWWLLDLAWPIGGGAALGVLLGRLLGHALVARGVRGDPLARDELLYVGAVALALGLARASYTSAFVVVFMMGATVLEPLRRHTQRAAAATNSATDAATDAETNAASDAATASDPPAAAKAAQSETALWDRLHRFGARIERLVEAATVLAVGVALVSVPIGWRALAYGVVLVALVRPLSVLAVVRQGTVARSQRRLLAWFGIRGVGSLFYLAYVVEHGVAGPLAEQLTGVVLTGIALSIVLHGVSATPLMTRYQRRRMPAVPTTPPTPPPA